MPGAARTGGSESPSYIPAPLDCKFAVGEESSCAHSKSCFNRLVRKLPVARRDFFRFGAVVKCDSLIESPVERLVAPIGFSLFGMRACGAHEDAPYGHRYRRAVV